MSVEFWLLDQVRAGRRGAATTSSLSAAARETIELVNLPQSSRAPTVAERERALMALEQGKILFLPHQGFDLSVAERRLLDPRLADLRAKNIRFDPATFKVTRSCASAREQREIAVVLRRFGQMAEKLVAGLLPDYAPHLETGRASLRPERIEGRTMPIRKDDRRLHVDAMARRPLHGRRILRVFTNANADGAPRVWCVGPPFPQFAARFLQQPVYIAPGSAAMLALIGVTKGKRSDYDWLMLALHDRAKRDQAFQQDGVVARLAFPPGSTWIAFTDTVPHAAISGQFALEQSFYLPVAAMRQPELAPLHILEDLTGKRLVQ